MKETERVKRDDSIGIIYRCGEPANSQQLETMGHRGCEDVAVTPGDFDFMNAISVYYGQDLRHSYTSFAA